MLKNLANRGIEAENDVQHIDKLNDGDVGLARGVNLYLARGIK